MRLPRQSTHLLDAGADLPLVKDWLGHANIQNTTIYAQLTNPARDQQARKLFASHRVVRVGSYLFRPPMLTVAPSTARG